MSSRLRVEEDIRFRGSNTLFTNAKCIFVEYMDLVQLAWYPFLNLFRKNTSEKVTQLFDFSPIKGMGDSSLMVHYLNRPYRNPLAEFVIDKELPMENLDKLLNDLVEENEICFDVSLDSIILAYLKNIITNRICHDIRIWHPRNVPLIQKDITDKLQDFATFVSGPLETVLLDVPNDTTYIFSDIFHVLELENLNKLDFNAVMVADDYRYNYVDDDRKTLLVDMDRLATNHVFKLAKFHLS